MSRLPQCHVSRSVTSPSVSSCTKAPPLVQARREADTDTCTDLAADTCTDLGRVPAQRRARIEHRCKTVHAKHGGHGRHGGHGMHARCARIRGPRAAVDGPALEQLDQSSGGRSTAPCTDLAPSGSRASLSSPSLVPHSRPPLSSPPLASYR